MAIECGVRLKEIHLLDLLNPDAAANPNTFQGQAQIYHIATGRVLRDVAVNGKGIGVAFSAATKLKASQLKAAMDAEIMAAWGS